MSSDGLKFIYVQRIFIFLYTYIPLLRSLLKMSDKDNTKVSKTNLRKLHKKDDRDIDYKDNPATNKAFWKDAIVFMPKKKNNI